MKYVVVCLWICVRPCMYVHLYEYMNVVCVCVMYVLCVYVCACVCVCVCVCACIYIFTCACTCVHMQSCNTTAYIHQENSEVFHYSWQALIFYQMTVRHLLWSLSPLQPVLSSKISTIQQVLRNINHKFVTHYFDSNRILEIFCLGYNTVGSVNS